VGKQVLVLGAGVGGLSAAIYARLAGHAVLVLEQHGFPGGKAAEIQHDGFRLDPGPSIIILKQVYEDLFRAAGRDVDQYLHFQRLDPISRVFMEGEEQFDLPASRAECLNIARERWGRDGENLERLFTKLDRVLPHIEKSIFSRPFDQSWHLLNRHLIAVGLSLGAGKSYKELVDRHFKSPLLRAFFYGFPSYGGQSYNSSAPGAFLIPYLMIDRGVFYPRGGVGSIPKAMFQLAVDLGVEFQFNTRVTGLRSEGRSIRKVETATGLYDSQSVISNVDRTTTGAWLGRQSNVEPSFSYFTLHWGLRKKMTGLDHHNLFIPKNFQIGFNKLYDEHQFPDPPIVYLNATDAIDPTAAPEGMSKLFAVVTSPARVDQVDWQRQADSFRGLVVETLGRQGLDITDSDIVFERCQTPLYFEEAHGNYLGSLYGTSEKHRLFGMFPQRNFDEEIDNLFYCGGSVQPGAGLPMVILSGKFAAQKLG
jgi:diapolycopene oxygenase